MRDGEGLIFEFLSIDGLAASAVALGVYQYVSAVSWRQDAKLRDKPAVKSPPWIMNLRTPARSVYGTRVRLWTNEVPFDDSVEVRSLEPQRFP